MPSPTWNLQWLNHNAVRHYPLVDDATATSNDDAHSVTLPDSFLVELDLPVDASMDDMEPGNFFIRMIGIYATGYMLTVAYDGEDGIVDVATAMIPRVGHTRNKAYTLGGIAPFEDTWGKVVIGVLDDIDEQASGLWNFDVDDTRLEPDCIRPALRGVSGLICVNGNQRSDTLTGVVELIAGTNIRLTPGVSGGEAYIQIDAISGEGTVQSCVCESEEAQSPCIRRINGVAATADGKFYLIGDNCIQLETQENGVKFVDRCCQPCCSCPELEAITADLERMRVERATYELFQEQLSTAVNQMSMTVLGARLGTTCTSCT